MARVARVASPNRVAVWSVAALALFGVVMGFVVAVTTRSAGSSPGAGGTASALHRDPARTVHATDGSRTTPASRATSGSSSTAGARGTKSGASSGGSASRGGRSGETLPPVKAVSTSSLLGSGSSGSDAGSGATNASASNAGANGGSGGASSSTGASGSGSTASSGSGGPGSGSGSGGSVGATGATPPSRGPGNPTTTTTSTPAPPPPPLCTPGDVTMSTTTDSSSYSPGQTITATTTVVDRVACVFTPVAAGQYNCGTSVVFTDGHGQQVFPLPGQSEQCAQPASATLQPGQAESVAITWNGMLPVLGVPSGAPPGQYTAVGTWTWSAGPGQSPYSVTASSPAFTIT
ncbi:MAG TPA: hypothetical protein VKU86_15175 [Acidimicrobiales bacterium]|nr:hypothetical protein [Acidimicrobiales bacterium]